MNFESFKLGVKLREEEIRCLGFTLLRDLDILDDYSSRGEEHGFYRYMKLIKKRVKTLLCPDLEGHELLEYIWPDVWEGDPYCHGKGYGVFKRLWPDEGEENAEDNAEDNAEEDAEDNAEEEEEVFQDDE